jgi:hypothetical protein
MPGCILIVCLALTACATAPETRPVGLATPAADGLPAHKDLLHALLRNVDVPLSVDPSCSGVGTNAKDDTIGAYLSGFLAELSDPDMRNSIQVSTIATSDSREGAVWQARILIAQEQGEVVWQWGVTFLIRQADREVIRESFRCIGAG